MISHRYSTHINIRQTTTTAAGTTVWSMANPSGSGKIVTIEEINLIAGFDQGTLLGATTLRYALRTFSAAVPSGGTAQSAEQMLSTSPESIVTDIRSNIAGLTITSLVFGSIFCTIGVPSNQGATSTYRRNAPMILQPGEGLCIQLQVQAANGLSLTGDVTWSEK